MVYFQLNKIHWIYIVILITVFCFHFLQPLPLLSFFFVPPSQFSLSVTRWSIWGNRNQIKIKIYHRLSIVMEKKIPKKQTNKNLTSLKHQHVCINNRRVGAREGEVQVNHRRFGPDFLRTLGVLEISTTLLLPLPLLLFTLGWISLGNIITFFALFSFFALISLFLLDWWIETWIENISVRPFAPFFHVVFFFFFLEERTTYTH